MKPRQNNMRHFVDIFDTLRPSVNGRHSTDDILKCIFLKENVWIPIKISLKFVTKGPIDNIFSIGLDNGLAPTRRQAIIWTNDGTVQRRIDDLRIIFSK